MYLPYFNKFLYQVPYLHIDEKEWIYIKETFNKDDVKESLAKVAMTYPQPTMEISENQWVWNQWVLKIQLITINGDQDGTL